MFKLITKERLVIIILILILFIGVGYHLNSVNELKKQYELEVKLNEALADSMKSYKNARGEWEYNKRTLQAKINDLSSQNDKLNADQKELVSLLNSEKRKNNIITAALVRAEVRIDSLNNLAATASEIDTITNSINFKNLGDTASHFQYSLTTFNVRPSDPLVKPTLKFNSLVFPNKQYITFQFDENERKDYPISFSISNSNPYYNVLNIESYAIPGLQRENVNELNGWQKTWNFIKINGKYILIGTAGFGLGYLSGK